MTGITYYVDEIMTPEDAYEIEITDSEWRFVAEEAAENFHSHHDGWECSWPLTFVILRDKIQVGKYVVDRESVPHFYAVELK